MSSFIDYSHDYEALIPYGRDEIGVCVRNPRLLPRWLYFFAATAHGQEYIWAIAIVEFIMVLALAFIVSGMEPNPQSLNTVVLYLAAVIMNIPIPVNQFVRNNISRFFLLYGSFVMFFGIQIFNAYFYNILMETKYEYKMKTFDEVRSYHYKYLSSVEFMVSFDIFSQLTVFFSEFSIFFLNFFFFARKQLILPA